MIDFVRSIQYITNWFLNNKILLNQLQNYILLWIIYNVYLYICVILKTPWNSVPLSDLIATGKPKRAIIFSLKRYATSWEVLVYKGINSTHLLKTSTQIKMWLKPYYVVGKFGIKSTAQTLKGLSPFSVGIKGRYLTFLFIF